MPDISMQYKKKLRSQIMVIVLVLVGFYVLNTMAMGVLEMIFIFTGNIGQIMEEAVTSGNTPNYDDIYNIVSELPVEFYGIASIVGIIAGALMMFILRGKRLLTTDISHVNEPVNFKDLALIVVLMFGVQAVTSFAAMLIEPILNAFDNSMLDSYESGFNVLMTVSGMLYVVLIGPIVEEIMFRGAIMRSLERFGVNFAIIISSLLFGAYHIILYQAVFAFFLGILLAYVAHRFSLKWSIALHIFNNGMSMALSLLGEINETMMMLVNLAFLCILVLALIGSILILALQRQRMAEHKAASRPASMFFVLGLARQPLFAQPGYQPVVVSPLPSPGYQQVAAPPLGYQQPAAAPEPPPPSYQQPVQPLPPRYQQPVQPPPQQWGPDQPWASGPQAQPQQPWERQVTPQPQPQWAQPSAPQPQQPWAQQTAPQPQQTAPQPQPQWAQPAPAAYAYQQPQYPFQLIPINEADLKKTGVLSPLALPDEPVPHPFRITLSSPFLIVALTFVLILGLLMIVFM